MSEAWALTQKFRLCSPSSPSPGQEGRVSPRIEGESKGIVSQLSRKERLGEKKIQLGLVSSLRVRYARNLSHVEDSVAKNLPHPWARKMLDLMSFILAG